MSRLLPRLLLLQLLLLLLLLLLLARQAVCWKPTNALCQPRSLASRTLLSFSRCVCDLLLLGMLRSLQPVRPGERLLSRWRRPDGGRGLLLLCFCRGRAPAADLVRPLPPELGAPLAVDAVEELLERRALRLLVLVRLEDHLDLCAGVERGWVCGRGPVVG